MQPLTTQAYDQAHTQFLEQFQLLSHLMLPTADVNVDEEDIRAVLRQAHSLRIGNGRASGPERAARATHKALEHARQHRLGPLPSKAAQAALLRITSRRGAELEIEELATICAYLQNMLGQHLEVAFGHDTEADLPAELQVCLLLGYGASPLMQEPASAPQLELDQKELLVAAARLVTMYQKVSVSFLQRHLGTGYNRTCQLLEQLEAAGIIRRLEVGGHEVVEQKKF